MNQDQALALAPDLPEMWLSTSRNWWHQGLLERTLGAYPGFDSLAYLASDLAYVAPAQTAANAELLRNLLGTIARDPAPFAQLDYTEDDHATIARQITEAQVSRQFDDDSALAHGNFFSFLLSHAAALDDAAKADKGLLYIQPQPHPSESRLP